jgi:hypothetical protein
MSLERVLDVLKKTAPDIEVVDIGRSHTTAIISASWVDICSSPETAR